MKNYEKMLNTVKAIQETFGSEEFTRKDYENEIGGYNNVYGATTALTQHSIAKVVRKEDFITKDCNGNKIVSTRYFYEVNRDFIKDLYKMIDIDRKVLEGQIAKTVIELDSMKNRLNEKQKMLDLFTSVLDSAKNL